GIPSSRPTAASPWSAGNRRSGARRYYGGSDFSRLFSFERERYKGVLRARAPLRVACATRRGTQGVDCDQGPDRRDRPEGPPPRPPPPGHLAGPGGLLRDRPGHVLPYLRGGGGTRAGVLHGLRHPGDLSVVGPEERRALRRVGRPHRAAAPSRRPVRGLSPPVLGVSPRLVA